MKQIVLLMLIAALAGCGGVHKAKRSQAPAPRPAATPIPVTPTVVGVTTPQAGSVAAPVPVAKPFATGPINSACMGSDRKARSRDLCGCIQAVADTTLSNAQQRLAVSFYNDPHKAQEIRQSSQQSDRDFWQAYRAYGEAAERTCR